MNSPQSTLSPLPDYAALLARGRRLRSEAVHEMLQRLFSRVPAWPRAMAPRRTDRGSMAQGASPSCA